MARSKNAGSDDRFGLLIQVLGVVLLAAGLLCLVSLISHSPEDPPNSSRPPELAENLAGWFGAHLSYRLLFVVGLGAYALDGLLFAWGWFLLKREPLTRLGWQTAAVLILMTLYCAATGVPSSGRTHQAFQLGGWLGVTLSSQILVPYLGQVGSAIFLTTALIVLAMVATDLPISRVPDLIVQGLRAIGQGIVSGCSSVVAFLGSLGGRTLDWVGERREVRQQKRAKKAAAKAERAAAATEAAAVAEVYEEEIEEEEEWEEEEVEAELFEEPEEEPVLPEPELPEEPIPPAPAVKPKIVTKKQSKKATPSVVMRPAQTVGDINYKLPSLDLLDEAPSGNDEVDRDELLEGAEVVERSLDSFGVEAKVKQVNPGPVITSYEVQPPTGVKINKIVNLSDDLALVMKARSIRIQAPIPGKAAVGIEVPRPDPSIVYLRDVLEDSSFQKSKGKLMIGLGKTATGEPISADLTKMPHLLIAGATGAGKSFCINALIASMLFRATPEEVRFIMVDPKMLELSLYDSIPHLFSPVVTDPKIASDALKWAVAEMENRYRNMSQFAVRNITEYNNKLDAMRNQAETQEERGGVPPPLPYLVVVIDELADLMLTAPRDIENSLARLAQMARAVGIHLILATQRPSVNVITGTIKANFPSRIAFRVASKVDSRTILDTNGAEKLLGNGDMLFLPSGKPEPIRVHGAYIETEETERLVEEVSSQGVKLDRVEFGPGANDFDMEEEQRDARFDEALRLVVMHQQGSASLLQRRMKVGYARAARLVDELERAGVVGASDGSSKARPVLVDEDYLERMDMLAEEEAD
ncbi:MAG: cell division protein FtsK [Gemmatimonadetes bacterium]|nr:cell division protein FtsK [Gemmatimonadota bacterium]